jgi:hypothetical protein
MLPYSTGRLIQEPDNNLGKQHLHPGSFAYYPPILETIFNATLRSVLSMIEVGIEPPYAFI